MSFRERRPGYWEVRIYIGRDPTSGRKRYRSRVVTGGERDAKRLEARMITQLADEPAPATEGTVAYVAEQVIDHLEALGRSPTTIAGYRRLAEGLKPIGQIPLTDLTPRHVSQFYATLTKRGASPANVEHYHRFLHRVLAQAVRWEWAPRNVASGIERPTVERHRVRPPEGDQVRAVLEEARKARNPDIAIAFVLLAGLGCRRGEVCGLRWNDIDLETGLVQIQRAAINIAGRPVEVRTTKTHQHRSARLGPGVLAQLVAWRFEVEERARWADCDLVTDAFVLSDEPNCSAPWSPSRLTRAFGRIRDRLSLTCRLHDLRHWNASQLLDRGEDVTVVAGRLGHRDASTTHRIYAHVLSGADDRAAEIIDEALD